MEGHQLAAGAQERPQGSEYLLQLVHSGVLEIHQAQVERRQLIERLD